MNVRFRFPREVTKKAFCLLYFEKKYSQKSQILFGKKERIVEL